MRRALAAPISVLALLPVIAQPPQQPQQPIFRAGVDVVAVDVHVVDGAGRPVPGLTPEEFAITVDGTPRSIVAAHYVSHGVSTSVTPAAPAAPETAHTEFTSNREGGLPAPGRTILLVVDEENIRTGYARAAAQAAGRFLDRLQPADRVGLVVMPRTRVAIDPTTDRAQVRDALTHITGHLVSVNTQLDTIFALGVSEAFAKRQDLKKWAGIKARECGRPSAPPSCPAEMDMYAEAMMADARQRGQNTTRAIVSLMDALAQLPGPKTLVYISEELPVAPYLSERAEFNSLVSPLGSAAARAQATFYVLQLDR